VAATPMNYRLAITKAVCVFCANFIWVDITLVSEQVSRKYLEYMNFQSTRD